MQSLGSKKCHPETNNYLRYGEIINETNMPNLSPIFSNFFLYCQKFLFDLIKGIEA